MRQHYRKLRKNTFCIALSFGFLAERYQKIATAINRWWRHTANWKPATASPERYVDRKLET